MYKNSSYVSLTKFIIINTNIYNKKYKNQTRTTTAQTAARGVTATSSAKGPGPGSINYRVIAMTNYHIYIKYDQMQLINVIISYMAFFSTPYKFISEFSKRNNNTTY